MDDWTADDDVGAKVVSDRLLAAWAEVGERTREWPDLGDYELEPMARYLEAMADQAAAEAEVHRYSDLRARALTDLHVLGWSLARIAEATGLSRARAQQLVERGRDVEP